MSFYGAHDCLSDGFPGNLRLSVNTPCGRECRSDTAEGAIRPESLRHPILRKVSFDSDTGLWRDLPIYW